MRFPPPPGFIEFPIVVFCVIVLIGFFVIFCMFIAFVVLAVVSVVLPMVCFVIRCLVHCLHNTLPQYTVLV